MRRITFTLPKDAQGDSDQRTMTTFVDYNFLVDLFIRKISSLTQGVETRSIRLKDYGERVVAVQNFSDWHIGKKVHIKNKKTFGVDIAKERLRSIFDKSLRIINARGIKTLIVAINGDMVEGGGVNFIEQPYVIESLLDTQIDEAAKMVWEYTISASDVVDNVVVIGVVGNHGKAKIPDPTANFDLMTYRYVAHMLSHEKANGNYQNVDLFISPDEFFDIYPYENFGIHIRHLNRAKQTKTASGRARFLSTCDIHNVDVVLSGHWHTASCEEVNKKWNIINGSIVGMDDYAETLSLSSSPSQLLNIFEDNIMSELHFLT